MIIIRKTYQDIIDTLREDLEQDLELRFVTRVVFVNNLESYVRMVKDLSDMADEVVKISDEAYCSGVDAVPDLKKVRTHIAASKDKTLLITSIGEYLRFAQEYEKNAKTLHSIMTYPAHSKKRVWIPIYAAKDIFQDVVGDLSSERYELYELAEDADEFECFVYPDSFSENSGIAIVHGLRETYQVWDNLAVRSGMAFSTKKLSMIPSSTGNYAVHIIKSPFDYIQQHLKNPNPRLTENLGTQAYWAQLAGSAADSDGTLEGILKRALNVAVFDALQIVSGWGHLCSNDGYGKWLLWLWYKLGLVAPGDYLGYAIHKAESSDDIQQEIECAILDCVNNPAFDSWVNERRTALQNMGITFLSPTFWEGFKQVADERTKLKLLSNATHEERTCIIQIVSCALKENKKLSDYKSILSEKYPDLIQYLKDSEYLTDSLAEYFQTYKLFKLMDYYDLSISEAAMDADVFSCDSRSKILNSIKCSKDAYYLWIDGMGVEWIDMLVEKILKLRPALKKPTVEIGMAVVPTTTAVNMAKADPETVSYKYNMLDSLSHIKDKSNCNYYSIIDQQFALLDEIAALIVKSADENPGKSIVVTADHGMSRMAAKAFHEKPGITAPKGSTVENLGRYCLLPADASQTDYFAISHSYKEENCLAFRDHTHFVCSGYAPGEIHGGASPEEWLVPIIVFENNQKRKRHQTVEASYVLPSSECIIDNTGNVKITIRTSGLVQSSILELGTDNYDGYRSAENQWSFNIPNLTAGQDYNIRIHLNNVYSQKVEKITVKRRGLVVDDDF